MNTCTAHYDVVIVGGGISGLYTAWRLSQSTQLSIAVIECSDRFGGRFYTCEMPGEFYAEMGAMRYYPEVMPLMDKLVRTLGLCPKPLDITGSDQGKKTRYHFRNKHIKDPKELLGLYSIQERDKKYFVPTLSWLDLDIPESGDIGQAKVKGIDQNITQMSLSQFLTTGLNAECLNFGAPPYVTSITMLEVNSLINMYKFELDQYRTVKGGMENITRTLVDQLLKSERCKLFKKYTVTRIDERPDNFIIKMQTAIGNVNLSCKRIVLACNARGMELISWNSPHERTTQLQQLLGQVRPGHGFKIFFTYQREEWEKFSNFTEGSIVTDFPLGSVMAFGNKECSGDYITILAGYSFQYAEIFEGLNHHSEERFENTVGVIPTELAPSRRLVDYVQKMLSKVIGVEQLPRPVCAVAKIWSEDPIAHSHCLPKVGVDRESVYWKSLKPFEDADVYIVGDTFVAVANGWSYVGWSEGCLITCERVLEKYLNVSPFL